MGWILVLLIATAIHIGAFFLLGRVELGSAARIGVALSVRPRYKPADVQKGVHALADLQAVADRFIRIVTDGLREPLRMVRTYCKLLSCNYAGQMVRRAL